MRRTSRYISSVPTATQISSRRSIVLRPFDRKSTSTCLGCTFYGTVVLYKVQDGRRATAKDSTIFYRARPGSEPVREWLKRLAEAERHAIGKTCCARNGDGRWGCRYAGRWEAACGKSERICQRAGRSARCSAFTTSTSWRCTDLSRKRARRRMTIWHWHASGRRSCNDEQETRDGQETH